MVILMLLSHSISNSRFFEMGINFYWWHQLSSNLTEKSFHPNCLLCLHSQNSFLWLSGWIKGRKAELAIKGDKNWPNFIRRVICLTLKMTFHLLTEKVVRRHGYNNMLFSIFKLFSFNWFEQYKIKKQWKSQKRDIGISSVCTI